MPIRNRFLLAVPILALIVGCASQQRSYNIAVQNRTSQTITLSLEKDGSPDSEIWMTPEQLTKTKANADATWGLGSVPPGRGATVNDLKGTFPAGGHAWLRVYTGDLTIGEMMKIPRGNAERLDLPLNPGGNSFVIREEGDKLRADLGDSKP